MTPYQEAVKRYTDAGGTWPPSIKHVPRWPGSGRYAPIRCTECGQVARPMTATCSLCGEDLRP